MNVNRKYEIYFFDFFWDNNEQKVFWRRYKKNME